MLTAICMPFYIKKLNALQINQFLREEGPKSHSHKAKTPTMGGLVFMVTTLVVVLAMAFVPGQLSLSGMQTVPKDPCYFLVIAIGFLCGVVGLLDDSAKVINKGNKGISGYVRLAIETALGVVLAVVLIMFADNKLLVPTAIYSSFAWLAGALGVVGPLGFAGPLGVAGALANGSADLSYPVVIMTLPAILFIALGAFLTAATTNAVNLHDGMDGLAAGTACQVFAAMAVILFLSGGAGSVEPLQYGYATISATAAGALLGFLLYNKNPAKIFMGDTGSLFIGGLMACLALAGGIVIWFVPLTMIYIAEALSVMAQVTYFKLTKPYTPEKNMSALALIKLKLTKRLPGEGKRLFRMAPLHHHYEAVMADKGWQEWQVVMAFWGVQLILCATVLLTFHYR
ncbi:phospho-N-acetylmuramoyl-pentapeptide-transferase [bacterium]|nr:phospho-N-acetylmuramoyl-pentapeptide-transferase [bacterium]